MRGFLETLGALVEVSLALGGVQYDPKMAKSYACLIHLTRNDPVESLFEPRNGSGSVRYVHYGDCDDPLLRLDLVLEADAAGPGLSTGDAHPGAAHDDVAGGRRTHPDVDERKGRTRERERRRSAAGEGHRVVEETRGTILVDAKSRDELLSASSSNCVSSLTNPSQRYRCPGRT